MRARRSEGEQRWHLINAGGLGKYAKAFALYCDISFDFDHDRLAKSLDREWSCA